MVSVLKLSLFWVECITNTALSTMRKGAHESHCKINWRYSFPSFESEKVWNPGVWNLSHSQMSVRGIWKMWSTPSQNYWGMGCIPTTVDSTLLRVGRVSWGCWKWEEIPWFEHTVGRKVTDFFTIFPVQWCVSARFFEPFLNPLFPKLASMIPTIATPLNAKPPTPSVYLPFLCQITPRWTKNDIAIGEDYSTITLGIPMGYTAE